MPHDVETLRSWAHLCLVVAAVCTTAFPVLWAFSRWWSTTLGRLLMLQAVSFSVAVDLTLLFHHWQVKPEQLEFVYWLQAVVFSMMALSTLLLTGTMLRLNYLKSNYKKERAKNEQAPCQGV